MLTTQFCFDFVQNRRQVMHQRMNPLDGNHPKAFLETAETGPLSAAAHQLGRTPPTLSRQVAATERQLAVTLFERVGKAMVPPRTGLALLDPARVMGSVADGLRMAASGQSEAVDGVVSISAAEPIAAYLLPSVLARLRQQAPGIVIDVVTPDALSDRLQRKADIAVRHVRPVQPDCIGRWIREATACERKLAHGPPAKYSTARCKRLSSFQSSHLKEPTMLDTVKRELIDSPEQLLPLQPICQQRLRTQPGLLT